MVPSESTAEEASFEWSHYRISFTDSQVKPTLEVSITDTGSERVNNRVMSLLTHNYIGLPPFPNASHPPPQKKIAFISMT